MADVTVSTTSDMKLRAAFDRQAQDIGKSNRFIDTLERTVDGQQPLAPHEVRAVAKGVTEESMRVEHFNFLGAMLIAQSGGNIDEMVNDFTKTEPARQAENAARRLQELRQKLMS